MKKIFGTDGIRGRANVGNLRPDRIMEMAIAAGRYFKKDDNKHTVIIGKDTRLSGYMFESALTAGFTSVGLDVVLVGPMPTPAIAMLTRSMRADLGVMVTASHNPYTDNGIKFFDSNGYKLEDEVELAIEALMCEGTEAHECHLADPSEMAKARRLDDVQGRYIEFVKSSFPRKQRLDGMKIVLDCANGAGYKVAPTVFWELGAEVVSIGCEPDGVNINADCGALHVGNLQKAVVEHNADIGIALDGDAGLYNTQGKKCPRDIVQFVPFSKFSGNPTVLTQ